MPRTLVFFQQLQKKILHIQQLILLHVVYLFGIGSTAFFAKMLNKHFLETGNTLSTWVNRSRSHNPEQMF